MTQGRRTRVNSARKVHHPQRAVVVLTSSGLVELSPAGYSKDEIGQKALGLLTLPSDWVLPFFVVRGDVSTSGLTAAALQAALNEAAERVGLQRHDVIIRSNASNETISDRGSLSSYRSPWERAAEVLLRLAKENGEHNSGPVHWIIQDAVASHAQGQLSNERRVSYENRDWALDIETGVGITSSQSIGVRLWRSGRDPDLRRLHCSSVMQLSVVLRNVAAWALKDSRRLLFEWVWDGTSIWMVQMDVADGSGGTRPVSVLPASVQTTRPEQLRAFHSVSPDDFEKLRKLANAKTYTSLGYEMPSFFVLDTDSGLQDFLQTGNISVEIETDLNVLTERPLILRTDGTALPKEKRQMLPRSEELRGKDEAIAWLRKQFRPKCEELGITDARLSLIAHHFIPSVASAWARAEPQKRWVRIESLWGIPEGLYWHAHDTFEVDTESADLSRPYQPGTKFPYEIHRRFKGMFIAPDDSGRWIHHETAAPYDWTASIEKTAWINEIAQATRRIAGVEGTPVEVMWFVNTHKQASSHRVLPWYHSEPETLHMPPGARRRKLSGSQDLHIKTRSDWEAAKEKIRGDTRIERVLIQPKEEDLVRNLSFAEEVGSFSAEHNVVVLLMGGLLSHAFHTLRRKGANVECIDPYGIAEERVEYNKLVRDKIPDHIASRGERHEVIRLSGEALLAALRRKLVEEAYEALDANSGTDLIGELADVQEVLLAIAKTVGSSVEELEAERGRKARKRGGFDDGLMLQTTSSPRSLLSLPSEGTFSPGLNVSQKRVVSNPEDVPSRSRYRRPDRRNVGVVVEDLLAVELELNRLTKATESLSVQSEDGTSGVFTVEVELTREKADLRLVLRVREKKDEVVPEQGKLFPE